jgi:hypothetical protein
MIRLLALALICVGAAPAAAQQLYSVRWVKTWPSDGQPWSTPWQNSQQPVCGHAAGCACGGSANTCGQYRNGDQTFYHPYGCANPAWAIRCEARQQAAAPIPTPPIYNPPPVGPPSYSQPNDLCPKNVGASQPTPPQPYDSPFLQCQKRAHNENIACDQNVCGQWRCGDLAATRRGNACLTACSQKWQVADNQCRAIYGRR